MPPKKSAHYQRLYRQRLRDMGLVKKEIWILPERAPELHYLERELRRPLLRQENLENPHLTRNDSGKILTQPAFSADILPSRGADREGDFVKPQLWTTQDLYETLTGCELFADGRASLELINAAEPCLLIIMHDYGDLPIYMTVSRQHILVEALLWPISAVRDPETFNREVLRTHKFFSLSTIGLDRQPDGEESYIMFGSLSATSILPNILFEIETLADNVIRATEAYEDFLVAEREGRK